VIAVCEVMVAHAGRRPHERHASFARQREFRKIGLGILNALRNRSLQPSSGLDRLAHEAARNTGHLRLESRHKNAPRGAIRRISRSQGVSS